MALLCVVGCRRMAVIEELPSARASAAPTVGVAAPVAFKVEHAVIVGDACCVLIDPQVAGPLKEMADALRAEGIDPVFRQGRLVLSLDHDRAALQRAAKGRSVLEEALRLLQDLELADF